VVGVTARKRQRAVSVTRKAVLGDPPPLPLGAGGAPELELEELLELEDEELELLDDDDELLLELEEELDDVLRVVTLIVAALADTLPAAS
jgi:hypothetical protein